MQEQNQAGNLAILVVGKMGHGKSSFVRHLVLPKDANPFSNSPTTIPTTSSGLQSTTLHPQIYQVHPSHNLTDNNPLYIIDTQGLDSNTSASLVVEQVDEIIKNYRLSILAIVFVVNMGSGRIIRGDGNSDLKAFLSVLKIKRRNAEELLFFVATNWRKCVQYGEENSKVEAIKQLIRHSGVNSQVFHKTIFWQSGPDNPKGYQKFKHYSQTQGMQQIQTQWESLKQSLSSQIPKSYSYRCYVRQCIKLWESVRQQVERCYKQKLKYSFQQSRLNIDVKSSAIGDGKISDLVNDTIKNGIDVLDEKITSFMLVGDGVVKGKMGRIAKKTQVVAQIVNGFFGFMPQGVREYVDGASQMAREMANILSQQAQVQDNQTQIDMTDVAAMVSSLGLILYSTYQYQQHKNTKLLNPTSETSLQELQTLHLKERVKQMQISMIQAMLYQKILFKDGKIILLENIDPITQIKIFKKIGTNHIGLLEKNKPVPFSENGGHQGDRDLELRLEIDCWLMSFQSFDLLYRDQVRRVFWDL